MRLKKPSLWPVFGALVFLCFSACLEEKRDPQEEKLIELSLFTGIPGIGRIGDSQKQIREGARYPFEEMSLEADSELGKLGVGLAFVFKEIGTKIYFKRDSVILITAQEPFKGFVKGKKIKLFAFSTPPVKDWEDLLLKELGVPESRASGGRFGSESLFYGWGDISFNRMGPNELALYRNAEISKYRLKNFGRELQLFPSK
jgi:hypothetical protein